MSDRDVNVNPAHLRALAADLRSESGDIQSALDRLGSEMGRLRSAWSGSAQHEYDVARADWTKTIDHMNAILQRIAVGTESTADAFEKADAAASGGFRPAG